MNFYKDKATGTFPLASIDEISDPELVKIKLNEYLTLVENAGADEGHPMRHEVKFAEEMAKAAEEAPPVGTVMPPLPDTPPSPDLAATIDEEIR